MERRAVDQLTRVAAVSNHLRAMIHDGTLAAGDPLPSTRTLAARLGVARGTVVAAYEQLDGEGYIRTRHGAVARVVGSIGPRPSDPTPAPAPRGSSTRPTWSPAVALVAPPGSIDLRPGTPSVRAIPVRDWRAAWRAGAEEPLRNALSDAMGTRTLREQIAAQLGLTRGFAPAPDRVVVHAGTSDALSVLAEALRIRHGRPGRIAVEDPGYRSGRRAMLSAGAELVGVPVADDGMDLAVLEALAPIPDAVMVTPTHQYPLGSVMPVAARQRLLVWAAAHDVVVVEDDYDSEFRHRGDPVPALAALDAHGVVLHLGGFSKILDPRIRCAYMVLPEARDLAEAIRASRLARGPVVSEVAQSALAHLIRSGALRRHLGRVRRDYAHRRDLLATRLAEIDRPDLEARALSGGLHAVLTWPGRPEAAAVRTALAADGVVVEELARYAVTPETAANGIVLGYAAVTHVELDRALDAIVDELAAR
jgi:DNA-binding transcriptional MocR family regulator